MGSVRSRGLGTSAAHSAYIDGNFGPSRRLKRTQNLNWCFDVYEEEDHIVVEADVPGFDRGDLDVYGDGSRLVLAGSRRHRMRGVGRMYFHRERRWATIHREVRLPHPVDVDDGEVTLRHGVLRVRLRRTDRPAREALAAVVHGLDAAS